MCAAGAFRGEPASMTTTRRRARPRTSAALRPAAPPPTIATSYLASFMALDSACFFGKLRPSRHTCTASVVHVEEARAVLARLERIDALDRARADPAVV